MIKDNTTFIEEKASRIKRPDIKNLVYVLADTFKNIKQIYFIYGLVIIAFSLLQTGNAYIWGHYLDMIQTGKRSSAILIQALTILLLYFVTGVIIRYLNKYLYGINDIERLDLVQSHKFQRIIGVKFFRMVMNIPYEYLEIADIRNKITRSSNFVNDKWNGLSNAAVKSGYLIVGQLVGVVINIILLYNIEPRLCIMLLIIPVPVLYSSVIHNRLNFKFLFNNTELSREMNYYETVITGATAKEVKIFGLSEFFFHKWKAAAQKFYKKEKKLIFVKSSIEILNSLITTITSIAVFILAVYFMVSNRISIGQFSTIIVISTILTDNIVKLLSNLARLLSRKNEAKELVEIEELGENKADKHINGIGKLQLKNLYYRYPFMDRFVLKAINFTMNKGESVAVVGLNGSGKTTFSKILLGLLTPSSGEYFINGELMDSDSVKSICDHMAVVFQDPVHFSVFNVKENIEFGADKACGTSIKKSLEFAGLEDIDQNMNLCREMGGRDLSGGQWQKLSIARAHYKDFKILLLDEPTSNIDPLAETELYRQYLSMAEGRTVIYITHRISAASLADRIIVFEDGSIVEDGKPDELIAKQGVFYKLFQTQYKWYDR